MELIRSYSQALEHWDQMNKDVYKSKAKCPRCGSIDLIITKHVVTLLEWWQENGVIDPKNSTRRSGKIIKVKGKCLKCNHEWTFRKISNAYELFELKQEEINDEHDE